MTDMTMTNTTNTADTTGKAGMSSIYKVPSPGYHPGRTTPVSVEVPGSKSITNRALLLATLAEGTSCLQGVLFSDDSRNFLKCIQALQFHTEVAEPQFRVTVTGQGGTIPGDDLSIYVGSAGTAARFLTAYLGISKGTFHLDASEQMRRRPMAPLLNALHKLGCQVTYEPDGKEGFFPFTLHGNGFCSDSITINIDHSSQFLSALLISACLSEEDFTIHVEGSHGMSYIHMTCEMMRQFGVTVTHPDPQTFRIPGGQHYHAMDYQIEPDVSAACYFYASAPLLGVPVLVRHVHFNSLQGDVEFLHILEKMGCCVHETSEGIVVAPGPGGLHGITVDMSACSDQAITLAAIAPFADSPTTITGIGHIRFQESNRIQAILTELNRMGIRCQKNTVCDGSLTIFPGTPSPCVVQTYEDHRMAMGFCLTGLRVPGMEIADPACCGKTFENYFQVLEQFLARI